MQFEKFPALRVLTWFLANPAAQIHFKQLCRELNLGPLTVKSYCEQYIRKGWLKEQKQANLRFFSLDNGNYRVKSIKRAFYLELLAKEGVEKLAKDPISLALYGSHASGEYDGKSDIDILVLGQKEQVDYRFAVQLEKKLKKKVQITVVPLAQWEKSKKSDHFMLSVLNNNIIIAGAPL